MPISCQFRDCKALLFELLSSAITSSQTFTFTFLPFIYNNTCRRWSVVTLLQSVIVKSLPGDCTFTCLEIGAAHNDETSLCGAYVVRMSVDSRGQCSTLAGSRDNEERKLVTRGRPGTSCSNRASNELLATVVNGCPAGAAVQEQRQIGLYTRLFRSSTLYLPQIHDTRLDR